MPETDMLRHRMDQGRAALALLSRLPVRTSAEVPVLATSTWAFPLAGLVLALLAGTVGTVAGWIGLAAPATALLVLATQIVTTGAMHEDGLADTADGFWGGWERARRLEIMKDSHIGTYGVLALILSLGLRWTALTSLIAAGAWLGPLIAAAILSRAAMPVMMHLLPHARDNGLSRHAGRPDRNTVAAGAAIAIGLTIISTGSAAIGPIVIAALVTVAMMALARAKIGGQTGDTLGATQQLCEIAVLLALTA